VPHFKTTSLENKDYLTRMRHMPHLQKYKFKKNSVLSIKVRHVPHLQNQMFT
jgi:hypothetical protein